MNRFNTVRRFHVPPEALGRGYQHYDVPDYLVKKRPQEEGQEQQATNTEEQRGQYVSTPSFILGLIVGLALLGGLYLAIMASFEPEPFIKTSPAPIVYPLP